MSTIFSKISASFLVQIFVFLFVNALFILKYVSRVEGVNAVIVLIVYSLFFLLFLALYVRKKKASERFFQVAFWCLLILISSGIIGALIFIDRYSVNVDRWSAVTFFLDGLFRGDYPYGVHTHTCETNYASPFPVWHLINLPFYLLKDVGIGLIFFLWATAFCVRYFTESREKTFLFLLLLCISPAYWWEIAVRSDSMSNAFLVFCFILWFMKKEYTLSKNFGLAILACGLIAATRLSAIVPVALFFFKPYLNLSWKRKIIFPLAIIGILFLALSPFIFWDTENWIFFSRNPFMSQCVGRTPFYVFVLTIILGCFMAYRWKTPEQFFNVASLFIFVFILLSQIGLIITKGIDGSIFTDLSYDISYFSLALPYCFIALSDNHLINPPA